MRIGIIALLQETNTFIAQPTTLRDFECNMMLAGQSIRTELADTDHEIGGFFASLESVDCDVVPIFATRALPYGTVTDETYQTLASRLLAELDRAGPLDGLLVAPHGATVSETIRDVDGDWLSRVRAAAGNDIPIVSTADPHGNLSPRMISAVDAMISYRTNPHVDQRARGMEAAKLLVRTLRGEIKPTMSAAFPPMLINIERQCTEEEPCRTLYDFAENIRQRPGVLSASIFLGFPYSDVPEMGSSVVVVTDNNSPLADEFTSRLAARMWEVRDQCVGNFIDVPTAMDQSTKLEGPVCMLDMGDNVGGGSAADGTILARELHRRQIRAFVCLYDPESVEMADHAGTGARVSFELGGKTDERHGSPLNAEFRVVSMHDGRFREPEPRHGGMRDFNQGRTAVLASDTGLTVMVTSRRMVPVSLHQLTSAGIDPGAYQVLVAKGVNAPLAAYQPVCPHMIRVNTPGVTTADVRTLEYQHRRRPMFPFESGIDWIPEPTSPAPSDRQR